MALVPPFIWTLVLPWLDWSSAKAVLVLSRDIRSFFTPRQTLAAQVAYLTRERAFVTHTTSTAYGDPYYPDGPDDPEATVVYRDSPLAVAARAGHLDAVELIVGLVSPEASSDWKATSQPISACLEAPGCKGLPIMRFLLERGFDTDRDLECALQTCADAAQLEHMALLLSHCAESDVVYPLLYRAVNSQESKILELLLEAGVDANHDDGQPFMNAVERGDEDCIKSLLHHGANPNAQNGAALLSILHNDYISLSRLLGLGVRPTFTAIEPRPLQPSKPPAKIADLPTRTCFWTGW
ncbi:hypothetical protein BDZ88DRAFT_25790 [Geranomyces variabilis]|nr:hypothetical protein BDZ88DRAFT_25790 [Geranomyces variabilis]KAJ3134398.1 hypothetical protein HDU90_005011 [Geranomyces variabilis]